MLNQSNVRHIKAGVSIEELADDIAHRTLIQSIMVRPVRDAEGHETGMYEIPAGDRRYRASKQKFQDDMQFHEIVAADGRAKHARA